MPKKRKPAPKERAPKGTGTVFWSEARLRYVARKPVGTKLVGNRRVTVYVTRSAPTEREAIRRAGAAVPPDPRTTTVSEWTARWLADLDHRPLTMDSYRHSVTKWIDPVLGAQPVRSLTPHMVESAARVWGKEIAANTVRLVLAHLRACLSAAVRAGLLASNPVASAKKPKGTRSEIDPFTPAELVRIIEEASARPGDRIVALVAATGCRRGEALALEVPDFEPAAGTVAITKGDVGRHGVGPPKSEPSVRTIRVPERARPAVVAATGKRKSGPLFPGDRGGRMSASVIGRRYKILLARLGLRHRGLHQLKHSVATALVSAGEPLGDVAAYLGDRVETIVRVYLHATGSDPAARLDRIYGGDKVAGADAAAASAPGKRALRRKPN